LTLDPVHDLQAVFRELMSAIASPGSVRNIGERAGRIDIETVLPKPLLAVGLTLLDAETVFCLRSAELGNGEAELARMTSARGGAVEEADFVFVIGGGDEWARALSESRPGTLVDPHLGATLVVMAEAIAEGGPLSLSGPGVEPGAALDIAPGGSWLAARAEKNREYPLGVDMILLDPEGRIVALPRTTLVAEAR
jgi:alpha-D-ribose 1-methylphosphonate 5-triphosphate synthase subunit PhnH